MPFLDEIAHIDDSYRSRQWIDSHCHFDFEIFDSDREQVWQQMQQFGCMGLVIPGVMAKDWPRLISLCETKPWFFALGLHPYFLDQHKVGDVGLLSELCQIHRPIAIGEFGLDFALEDTSFPAQIELCQQQLKLAQQLGLPVILHVRKAYDEMAAMIRRLGFTYGGVVHAFSGSLQQGQALIKLGFKLGIGGAVSHSRAMKLRKTLSQLPLSSIVLETDSPDMRPAFWQETRNTPLSLMLLAQIVASVRQCPLYEVVFSSNNNLLQVLPGLEYKIKLAK